MKHTPGPWKQYGPQTELIIDANGWLVAEVLADFGDNELTDTERCIRATSPMSADEIETLSANAHLIAAAPEMLEALQRLSRVIDTEVLPLIADRDNTNLDAALDMAIATITKALGVKN